MLQKILQNTIGFSKGTPVEKLKPKYTTPDSKFVTIKGMSLHYRITGEGPALFLIHGIGSSMHTWTAWHSILSKDFTVISIDNPGFGLSDAPPKNDFSFENYNSIFEQFLDYIGLDSVYMVGNSWGGILTWKFALYAPERLKKIILMNAVSFNTTKSELSDIGFILSIHPLTSKLTHYILPKSIVEDSYKNAVFDSKVITSKKVDTYYDLLLREGNREHFSQVLKNMIVTEQDYTDELRKIKMPTLIMWGEEDNLINVGNAYRLDRTIDHSELIVYKKIGHLPMEENPEKSASDAKNFLLKK